MDSKQKTVAFVTLGCKLNFSETSAIAKQFADSGFSRVESSEKADVYVVNTCTVTELANKKSKQTIKKLIKQNPNAKIAAVGCYTQLKPKEVAQIQGIDFILGSQNKFDILKFLNQRAESNKPIISVVNNTTNIDFTPTYSFGDRTRSFLKVQDGCNYYCSFCTIPKARGKSRNNSIINTVEKAKEVVKKGVKEIILTGVNIGDFGKSTNETFFDLLKALEQIPDLKRLRISSIEPNLLTEDIIKHVAKSKVILPHFHIPMQCGTNNLLKLMNRRYTTNLYAKRVELIKQLMPNACIAADVIVGVPEESKSCFDETMEFIKSLDISYLHIFTYSKRDDTKAAQMQNQVADKDKKERSQIMHHLADQKQKQFQESNLGTESYVLFEAQNNNNTIQGFTENYIRVEMPFNEELINKILKVRLIDILPNGNVSAKIIE